MPLNSKALGVVTRPLPKDKIKQRPGKGGMTFNYISADLVIDLLNEAFDHRWSTTIVSSTMHENTAVVGLELTVHDADGNSIHKQQFGSCETGRGMGPGEAFKGAASDALKKAATLLGIGLELYQDDDTSSSSPRLPQAKSGSTSAGPKAPVSPPRTPSAPKPGNPFSNGSPTAAKVPGPKPVAAPVRTPPAPKSAPATSEAPRANPFAGRASTGGSPNSTQMNAMTNLASKKDLSQSDMIALASITDAQGNPVQSFEELTHTQAIEVIKAAQL